MLSVSTRSVAKWRDRFQQQPSRTGLLARSRAPKSCPHKTKPAVEQLVLAQRRRTPGFGAERLKREFDLPCGISAINRILRQHDLTRKPRRRHQRKNDLRAIKAAYQPFTRFQIDVKYLTDIPAYWPQMRQRGLPKFQYTIRELSCGAQFLAYADEVSVTYSELAARRLLVHLERHGIDPATVVIQSDNGPEFDGTARHKCDRGFVHTIETLFGAAHRFIPPGCSNANADVESVHSTIETELYDIERFADVNEFLTKAATYQLWYNVARQNRSRGWKSPLDLLEQKAGSGTVSFLVQQGNHFFQTPNVIGDASGHRRSNAQGLVNPAEVVIHKVQRDCGLVILNLLGKAIGQPGKAAHPHPHCEILPFNKAGGNVFGIRVARDFDCDTAGAFVRAVVCLTATRRAVHLHQHGIINLTAKGIFNGSQIRLVSIRRKLDTAGKTAFQIVNELIRSARVACADVPARNQLCVGVNRRPRPHIAVTPLAFLFFRYVLFLGVAEAPNLIALNLGARQIAQRLTLVRGTGRAEFDKKILNRSAMHSGHANDGT